MDKAVNNTSDRLRWTQHFKEFSTMTELDRRAVIALIQSIRVVGKDDFEITYRYHMEYEEAVDKLARAGKLPPSLMLLIPTIAAAAKGAV